VLEQEMTRLKSLEGFEQILVEEMVEGLEIIIGAKNDFHWLNNQIRKLRVWKKVNSILSWEFMT